MGSNQDQRAVAGASSESGHVESEPGETPKGRTDRELQELMQGLRILVPGTTVLFAFLLTLPFTYQFSGTSGFQREVYFATLLAAAVSTVCFITPAVQHRMLFRSGRKERLLCRTNRYGLAGAASLSATLVAALLLVLDFLFSTLVAVLAVAAVATLVAWGWLAQPLGTGLRGRPR